MASLCGRVPTFYVVPSGRWWELTGIRIGLASSNEVVGRGSPILQFFR